MVLASIGFGTVLLRDEEEEVCAGDRKSVV